jgi:hypothetical protein
MKTFLFVLAAASTLPSWANVVDCTVATSGASFALVSDSTDPHVQGRLRDLNNAGLFRNVNWATEAGSLSYYWQQGEKIVERYQMGSFRSARSTTYTRTEQTPGMSYTDTVRIEFDRKVDFMGVPQISLRSAQFGSTPAMPGRAFRCKF